MDIILPLANEAEFEKYYPNYLFLFIFNLRYILSN